MSLPFPEDELPALRTSLVEFISQLDGEFTIYEHESYIYELPPGVQAWVRGA